VSRVAYLDCFGGLAGDMLLAALLDAGAPRAVLDDAVHALGLPDVRVTVERVERHGIGATLVKVVVPPSDPPRLALELLERVAAASIPDRVRAQALDALQRLVAVEAGIHATDPDRVHLHELGGADTLVDVCGAFALLDALDVERLVCSPLPYARGTIQGAHGTLPGPAPATLALLVRMPLQGVEATGEFVTPTGAAIAATAVDDWGELPAMTLEGIGYGAGTRDTAERPNLLRVVLGQPATTDLGSTADVVLLEANLDDLLPELVPDAIERCTAAGALDVWVAPVQMKKGRPGVIVSAIARPDSERAVAAALLEHTSTLGVRVSVLRRYELDRRMEEVRVDGRPIRVKIGLLDGRVVNVAPEHDDCAAVAIGTGRPVKQVWAEALVAATALVSSEPGS
jgi:uncharacterized protein (TIGR00299 family) protein